MSRLVFHLTLAICLLTLVPNDAFALAGSLDSPSIAAQAGADQEALMKALKNERHEFVGGHFINWFSTMYFRGDTNALNLFLDDLSKIDGVRLHVKIVKGAGAARNLEKDLGGCQWQVAHSPEGTGHSIQVFVYLGDGKIDLDKLYIPDIHGRTPEKSEKADDPE